MTEIAEIVHMERMAHQEHERAEKWKSYAQQWRSEMLKYQDECDALKRKLKEAKAWLLKKYDPAVEDHTKTYVEIDAWIAANSNLFL